MAEVPRVAVLDLHGIMATRADAMRLKKIFGELERPGVKVESLGMRDEGVSQKIKNAHAVVLPYEVLAPDVEKLLDSVPKELRPIVLVSDGSVERLTKIAETIIHHYHRISAEERRLVNQAKKTKNR